MHILHVEKMLFSSSGVTSTVRALARWQRAQGHLVSLFGCDHDGTRPNLPPLRDFTATRNPLALGSMIHNAQAAKMLETFLGRIGHVDVAHVHNLYHHLTPSVLPVLVRRRIAIVMTVHDYRLACPTKHFLRSDGVCMRCWPHKLYHAASTRCAGVGGAALAIETLIQRFLRRYVRWVERFLCPSEFMAGIMRGIGVPPARLVVVPNPIEAPVLPSDEPRRDNRLVFAGRLTAEKGAELMLDLAERLGHAEIVIAGEGRLSADLQATARRRDLKNVTFTGPLNRKELARLYASATAVVVPSRCMENSPQTMLEAMACGRLVIVPDYPTLRQWVTDGQTGRLFAPENSESLAVVAGQALADPAWRETMERQAAELVSRLHDTGLVGKKTNALYEEALRRCALRW